MKRKFSFMAVLLSLVFVLAACATDTAPAAIPEAGTQEEADSAGHVLAPIRIGGINDLSGPRSITGNQINNGAILKVEQINAAGGILGGRLIEFISYDNSSDPQETISAFQRLVELDGVSVVLGSDASGIQMTLIEISEELQVPAVGMPSAPAAVRDLDTDVPHPFMFLVAQPDAVGHAIVTANYIMERTDLRNPAIIFDQANAYSVAFVGGFVYHWENVIGGEITIIENFSAADMDYRTHLGRINASGADFIVPPITIPQVTLLANQAAQLGMDITFAGSLDMFEAWELINDPDGIRAIVPAVVYMGDPRMADFIAAYTERFGVTPQNKCVNGYDAMTAIITAIEEAGSDDPIAIRDALRNISNLYTLVSPHFTMNPSTHGPYDLDMVILRIEDGEMTFSGVWSSH